MSINLTLGQFYLSVLSDGSMRLDGGAMFGIVPRVVWEKIAPPDEQNRILLGLNCLLVRTPNEIVIIDTGIGDKWDNKQLLMYGIEHPSTLLSSLAAEGIEPSDVTVVINTHLHFDHAGGNTRLVAGKLCPTFPNARYYVQRTEYEHACNPHERDRASYLAENWQPLVENGQLHLLDGDGGILPGITVFRVPGHNLDTQLVRIDANGKTVVFFADVIPTTAHLPIAWVMGYDLYPVELMEQKKRLLKQAAMEQWLCVFEHEVQHPLGRVVEVEGKYRFVAS